MAPWGRNRFYIFFRGRKNKVFTDRIHWLEWIILQGTRCQAGKSSVIPGNVVLLAWVSCRQWKCLTAFRTNVWGQSRRNIMTRYRNPRAIICHFQFRAVVVPYVGSWVSGKLSISYLIRQGEYQINCPLIGDGDSIGYLMPWRQNVCSTQKYC